MELRARRIKRRGNVMHQLLGLAALGGFGAMSVDVGLVRLGRSQLSAAVDAAALSGTAELDGTPAGVTRAIARARSVAEMNHVLGGRVLLDEADIQIGRWASEKFERNDKDPKKVDAVRIVHAEKPLTSVLGAFAFGMTGYDLVGRSASARKKRGPARSTGCFLPLAVPDCWLDETPPGANPPPLKFQLTPSPADAIAWGMPDVHPSSDNLREQLLAPCDTGALRKGERLNVDEGNHTLALKTLADLLNDLGASAPETWNTELYGPLPERAGTADTANRPSASSVQSRSWGNTIEGPIALVDAGPTCSTASFTGDLEITGLAWGVIYDVQAHGSDHNLYLKLDVVNRHEVWGELDTDPSATGNIVTPGGPQLVKE